MKNSHKGFILPLLLIIIALAFVGGGAYVYLQNKQSGQPETVSPVTQTATTSVAQTSDLKTYTNAQHGYSVSYPATVTTTLASGDFSTGVWSSLSQSGQDWYKSSCVVLRDANQKWIIYISSNKGSVLCGSGAGNGMGKPMGQTTADSFNLNGEQMHLEGTKEDSSSDFNFDLNSYVHVEYGVEADTTLSEQDYQSALDSAHTVLTTLKPLPGFVPSNPPVLQGQG
jgi:hypothetical protein